MYFVVLLILTTFPALLGSPAFGQEKAVQAADQDLKPLEDDMSRADLFKLVIEAAEKEDPDVGRALALNGPFQFPKDAQFDGDKPRLDSIFGIDISHYTGTNFKFDQLKQQNIRFVYAKATQGLTLKDNLFARYWKTMDELPADKSVLRGAYHFLSSDGDGTAQADTFLQFLEKSGGWKGTDMPPVVDLEWDITASNKTDRWQRRSTDEIINTTLAWLKRVEEKTGRIPAVYTARAWWRGRNIPEATLSKLGHYKIWIADYSRSARAVEVPPSINNAPWQLWQFSETARVAQGFDGALDANIYKGTEDQFAADFGLTKP